MSKNGVNSLAETVMALQRAFFAQCEAAPGILLFGTREEGETFFQSLKAMAVQADGKELSPSRVELYGVPHDQLELCGVKIAWPNP